MCHEHTRQNEEPAREREVTPRDMEPAEPIRTDIPVQPEPVAA